MRVEIEDATVVDEKSNTCEKQVFVHHRLQKCSTITGIHLSKATLSLNISVNQLALNMKSAFRDATVVDEKSNTCEFGDAIVKSAACQGTRSRKGVVWRTCGVKRCVLADVPVSSVTLTPNTSDRGRNCRDLGGTLLMRS